MDTEITKVIHKYVLQGRIRFKKHALIRIVERNIKIDEIESVLHNFKIIESYPDDQPLPSYLLLGFTDKNRPLHIKVAIDDIDQYIWIITAYEPDRKKWDNKFTKRKMR